MTDNTQSKALRMADALEGNARTAWTREEAAAELRRQHARIAELEAQLEAIGAGGVSPLIGQQASDSFTAADMATASAQGFRDGVASLAASAESEPVAWPKDATEVREFFRSDFIRAEYVADDHQPCDEDRYYISAHDFLSAINWWADFPHHPSTPEGMAGGWISVDERLPEPNVEVLCAGQGWGNPFVTACYYDDERREWYPANTHWTDATGCAQYPTHWQPLPLPPAPSTEGEKA